MKKQHKIQKTTMQKIATATVKKLLPLMTALILTGSAVIPATAAKYDFEGAGSGAFGKPTSVEPAVIVGGPADESANINRSKDSTIIPPGFGSPASDTPGTGELLTPFISGVTVDYSGNYGDAVIANSGENVGGAVYYPASPSSFDTASQLNVTYSTNSVSTAKFTAVDGLFYPDGSIGTLSIKKLNVSVKAYQGESLENMKKGVGHFESTSCWEGNISFAGHNRGVSAAFGKIHTLAAGDRITYTTKLGIRTYEVYSVSQIYETDTSKLQRTPDNIVTLITCVNDISELRWCVQAREVR